MHKFDYRWTLADAHFTNGQRHGFFVLCLWGGVVLWATS